MTGLDRNEDEIKALEVGATDFIKKPPVPKIVSARVKNILKLQKVTHELFIMSRTDPLTGAFNRRHFMETGAAELNRSSRYGSTFSMIMLDIDHFKSINDTYGHDIGDKALIEAVQIINKALRTEDTLGRFGGEEFCILLPETSQKSAIKVAERIRSDIEANKIHTDKGALKFTVSCGVSQLNTTNNSLEKIIKKADNALYNSKKTGRNRTTAAEEIQD